MGRPSKTDSPGNNHRGNKRGKASEVDHRRAQAELMWNDRLAGMTNRDIALKYNVGERTVTNRFKEFPKEGYDRSVATDPSGGPGREVALTETAAMWDDKVNHGMTNKDLAEKYGISTATVMRRLQGFFPEKEMLALEKHRLREDDKLDMLEEKMLQILNTDHFVVDKGQVIYDPRTGQPLVDDAPKMAAADRILKIIDAKRKMFGLDSPTRHEVTHNDGVEISVKEVSDAVAEAHRRNQERLAQIRGAISAPPEQEEEVTDAEIVDDDPIGF